MKLFEGLKNTIDYAENTLNNYLFSERTAKIRQFNEATIRIKEETEILRRENTLREAELNRRAAQLELNSDRPKLR